MKKALIVGIDHYSNPDHNLSGCIRDAEKIGTLLANHYHSEHIGEPNFNCKVLCSSENLVKQVPITRQLLKKEIEYLFDDNEADVALLYFSGHGYESSLGGYLVTQDAAQYDEGVSFNDIMIYANNSSIKEIIIILDCCYSGGLGDIIIANNQIATIRKGISILTASNANQVALEYDKGGVFTNLVCDALKGGNSDILGHVKLTHIYEHAERMLGPWEQRPTFKSNSSRLSVLRKAPPKVPYDILKEIKSYFPGPEYCYRLDSEYVPSQKHGILYKEKIFMHLQKLANNGLVRPLNASHMYYAGVNSKHCKLTEHGKQYWHLLNKDLI